jgi:hypothetical protein
VEEEITKVVEDNLEALRNGDLRFLENNLSDDFLGIGPLGLFLTKKEWLAGHNPPNWKYLDLRLQDRKVRTYGSHLAILTARQISSAKFQGNVSEGDFLMSEVFVNENGHWLLANLQLSPIQQPLNKAPEDWSK